jgi:hypothetical protein
MDLNRNWNSIPLAHFSKQLNGRGLTADEPDRELEVAASQGQLEDEGWRV